MRYLITGGCGFIGSHLTEQLVKEEHTVKILDDMSSGKLSNIQSVLTKIRVRTGTVTDLDLVTYMARDVDVILHLATQCLVKGLNDPYFMHRVNDVGTFNVCLAAKANKCKIVFVGTSEMYGPQTKYPITEEAPLNPVSIYGLTKVAAENYVRFFHNHYDVPAVCIRPFNTYGPRQRSDRYAGVITSFISSAKKYLPFTIQGDGKQTRDFTYIDDMVQGILLLSKLNDCETVNLGSGKETSIKKLAEIIAETCGYTPYAYVRAEPRSNDLRRLRADISLAKKYGYKPTVKLKEGIRKYAESFN